MKPMWIALSCALTVLVYAAARAVYLRYPSPLATPVFIASLVVMAVLMASGLDYADYRWGASAVVSFLGPATTALAVPLYRNRRIIVRYAWPALLAMSCGALATLAAAVAVATAFGLAPLVIRSIEFKSVTTPIAVELALLLGGDPSLTAAFVVVTGLIGAFLGPVLLNCFAVHDPVARGLAFGTIAQGFGTVQAMTEGDLQGAVSGVAMGAAAICVSLWAPALTGLIG